MIVRMVRMTFQPEKIDDFLAVFQATKSKIRAFEGCQHLELLRDVTHANVFFTYSHWHSAAHLNNYKKSKLFGQVWPSTKKLFLAPPEAWSTEQLEILV